MTEPHRPESVPIGRRLTEIEQARRARARFVAGLRARDSSLLYPASRQPPTPPTLYVPAMPPLSLIAAARRRWRAWRARAWLRALLRRDEHTIRELGFSRRELRWALALPTEIDATEALRQERMGFDTQRTLDR